LLIYVDVNGMKYKISSLLYKWLMFRYPTVQGKIYIIKNPLAILKNSGTIKLTNRNKFTFDRNNKKDILNVVLFALDNGIEFGNGKYQWKIQRKKEGN